MPSNLPSSYSRAGAQASAPTITPPAVAGAPKPPQFSGGSDSTLPFFIAVLSLIIALAALYGAFFAERPVSPAQKEVLLGIANDLKTLQEREIALSAPVQTTIELNRSYPISELFPAQFEIPIDFTIPVDTQLVGVSTTGVPVAFRVQEEVPIKAIIPINSARAFGNKTIQIQKTLPVEAKFTSIVKVRTAYGTDLNSMIDKLNKLAGQAS